MNLHLAEIAKTVVSGAHAVLLVDQAGWHMSMRLVVPHNITIIALPPKSPELNPVENVWQFMRDNWLSNRVFKSYDDLVDHCCEAWNELSSFPKSKYDDQVDSTSQALEWLKQRAPGWGILEYYRLAVEEQRLSMTRMVNLKVPAGTSHVQTITGVRSWCAKTVYPDSSIARKTACHGAILGFVMGHDLRRLFVSH